VSWQCDGGGLDHTLVGASCGVEEKGIYVIESVVDVADTPPSLEVDLQSAGADCRLILRGVLCETSIAALEAQIDQLGCLPCEVVVIDIRELTQMEPVGANVILGLYYYVVGRGGTLRVTTSCPDVAIALHAVAGTLIPIDTCIG
jgi:anti-anti-sigma regulatory factor